MAGQDHVMGVERRIERAYDLVVGGEYCELIAASKSGKTLLNYESSVRSFLTWCEEHGRQPMPADTAAVRDYIRHLVGVPRSHSTIRAHVAALCTWHRLHGHRIDRGPLYDILRGAAIKAAPAIKAKPLLIDDLREILAALDPTKTGDVRDGALLSLAYAGALRASEACGLDWRRSGGLRGDATQGYAEVRPEGLLLVITHSKTGRLTPQSITVSRQAWPATIGWVEQWVQLADIQPGQRVFAPLGRGGRILPMRLASASVTHIVRARVLTSLMRRMPEPEALLDSGKFSSHSLRRGMLQGSAKAGTPEAFLRARARHKSAETTAGYVELEGSWKTDWGISL